MIAVLILYRCCEHCDTDCDNPDQHVFKCYGNGSDPDTCEQGSQHAEEDS